MLIFEKKRMLKRKRELKKANRLKCKFCSFPVNEEGLDYTCQLSKK